MVKCFLVNAKRENSDFSIETNSGAIVRENLNSIPSFLTYRKTEQSGISFFKNSLGAEISIQEMGEYETSNDALEDYKKRDPNSNYEKTYNLYKQIKNGKDSDWNMILIFDESIEKPILSFSSYVTPTLNLQDANFFIFLDACMIYESFYLVKDFVIGLSLIKPISKFEVYFLGYCVENCNILKSPSYFLVNNNERNKLSEFYETWGIYDYVAEVSSMLDKSSKTVDLVSDYEENRKSRITSRLFSILTIIVGFTNLYNFFYNRIVRIILIVVFSVFALIILALSLKDLIIYLKDLWDFKKRRT